ncbi:hypothetical protein [Mucilaginibacter aquaedulcis]|uniref:hypothetical protein n=1 Tax=Mucilaginibacter aquaedulcis TaxID=1187081 RepID=UPI0025B39DDF|nr:hypothetical protein [Mucilaginibacter aquaedulcis]MDN3548746.1 hypothetical protein [Mucilaginibacter aquaedulcis]
MIILEPLGGLANRIRVIATAISLKKQLNQPLSVVWNENHELNCAFHLLFEPIHEFKIVSKKRVYRNICSSVQPDLKCRIKAALKNRLTGVDYVITERDFPMDNITERLLGYGDIYIQTCQCLNDNQENFKLFKPAVEVAYKIDNALQKFSPNTIGIQIRRTDNEMSIINSPIELFISQMHKEVAKDKSVTFFLTTDDQDVERQVINIFGEYIVSHAKELSRNTVRGMQDAATDLFTLSRTQKILGSYWSSFAEVAAWMGNIPLEVVKK